MTTPNVIPAGGSSIPPPVPQADGDSSAGLAVATQPRKLAGLSAGRIVNFVMLSAIIRPLLVVDPLDGTGTVFGILFFNGKQDRPFLPFPLQADDSGHQPASVVIVRVGYADRPEDPSEPLVANSWHWPQRDPVVAAGVVADALVPLVESAMAVVMTAFRDELTQLVNLKLQGHLDALNAILNVRGEEAVLGQTQRLAGSSTAFTGAEPGCVGTPPPADASTTGAAPALNASEPKPAESATTGS